MFIWLLTQSVCNGYDTYDSCVVLAPTAEEAKLIHPSTDEYWTESAQARWLNRDYLADWSHPEDVTATLIGYTFEALDMKVICASFNAG